MPGNHFKAMRAIEQCRTSALGGQVYRCPSCEQMQYSYHSCRNRHCPKCQNEKAQAWLEKQQDLLLNVPYFLLTFTVPAGFNKVARSHQNLFYTCTWCRCKCDLLFKTSAAATQQLAQEPRWIGGQIGMVGVLHTWGRNLAYHPHIHYLVPAGGWKDDEWLPVRALSRVFRGKLQQALRDSDCYALIPAKVWRQEWVVHCEAVGSGLNALRYLAPYIFRVALSNNRLLNVENDCVTFRYRDTETGTEKRCILSAEEFLHRFLQHVLPKNFVKVRYYGFFAPTLRARLTALRQSLAPTAELTIRSADQPANSPASPALQPHPLLCPHCRQPMLFVHSLAPLLCRSP